MESNSIAIDLASNLNLTSQPSTDITFGIPWLDQNPRITKAFEFHDKIQIRLYNP